MPQAVWTGELSFGLVSIPVKLYSATAPKRVRFHQYEAGTGRRIRYARVPTGPVLDEPPPSYEAEPEPSHGVETGGSGSSEPPAGPHDQLPDLRDESPSLHDEPASDLSPDSSAEPAEETEVLWEEVVKGYEVEPGRVVTVTPEELSSIAPERSQALEVEQFVDLREIDAVHFDKSYYIAPQVGGAPRSYWLLYRAMEASERVAVGRFVMRTKEYLAAIRPGEHVLMLETLFYADEVRDPKELWVPLVDEPSERELGMARQLIETLTGDWEPDRHRDEHRERLLDLLRNKAGEALVASEPDAEEMVSPVVDLMAALEASVEEAKRARREEEGRQTG